jgi:hypothetical protein
LQHPETRHAVRSAPTSLKKNASPNRRFTIPEGTNRQRPASTSLNGTLPQIAASPSPKERIGNDLLPHPKGRFSQKWSVPAPERTRPDHWTSCIPAFRRTHPPFPKEGQLDLRPTGSSRNHVAAPVLKRSSPGSIVNPIRANRAEAFLIQTGSSPPPGYELELVTHPDPLACRLIPPRPSDTRRYRRARLG